MEKDSKLYNRKHNYSSVPQKQDISWQQKSDQKHIHRTWMRQMNNPGLSFDKDGCGSSEGVGGEGKQVILIYRQCFYTQPDSWICSWACGKTCMCTLSVTTKYLHAFHLNRNFQVGTAQELLTPKELCRNLRVYTQTSGRLLLGSYHIILLGACHVVNLAVYYLHGFKSEVTSRHDFITCVIKTCIIFL